MASLILVPFNGGLPAQAALRAACSHARRDDAFVAAVYVALIPRQVPLSANLPWLTREVTRVQLLAEPIVQEAGANAWVEWVCARELAPALAGVAAELEASQILFGVRRAPRRSAWLRYWSLPERLRRLTSCPVTVHVFPLTEAAETRMPSEALS